MPTSELADYDFVEARDPHMIIQLEPDDPWHESEYMGGYFGLLLNSPPLAAALTRLSTLVRTAGGHAGTYSHRDREIVDQVLCVDWKTNIPMRTHLPDALAAGVRPELILALRNGTEEELTDNERLLATYVRQVVSGTVTDDMFNAIRDYFGTDRGALEYTLFIGVLQLTIRMMQALGVRDLPDEEFRRMLNDFLDGTRRLPNHSERIR
jgi:hypothetical protein